MNAAIAYLAATAHLAAAIVRHLADGLNLIGDTINPSHHLTITTGSTRLEWCDECRVHHETRHRLRLRPRPHRHSHPVGTWTDCDNDDQEDA